MPLRWTASSQSLFEKTQRVERQLALRRACLSHPFDATAAEALCAQGAVVAPVDALIPNALVSAILKSGTPEALDWALTQGASAILADVDRVVPLARAALLGQEGMMDVLLSHGAPVQCLTLVLQARHSGGAWVSAIDRLIDRGADINAVERGGPLLYVALTTLEPAQEVIEQLLARRADPRLPMPSLHETALDAVSLRYREAQVGGCSDDVHYWASMEQILTHAADRWSVHETVSAALPLKGALPPRRRM